MSAFNFPILLLVITTGFHTVIFISLYFWERCPRWYMRRMQLLFLVQTMAGVTLWTIYVSEPEIREIIMTFVIVSMVNFTLMMFVLNHVCATGDKIFKTWVDVGLYAIFNSLTMLAVQIFPVLLDDLNQRMGASGTAVGAQLFVLFVSLTAFQILRRLKSLPSEGSAAQLFSVEFICLNLQRSMVSQLSSLTEVAIASAASTCLNLFRIFCSVIYKRWQYDRLSRRNEEHERHFLMLLHCTDALTDMAAEILSIVAMIPLRIGVDPELFNSNLGVACGYSSSLENELAILGIQLAGALVAAVLIICTSQLILGPHTYSYVTKTSTGLLLRSSVATQVIMSIGATLMNLQRRSCIFCKLQADGETCS